MLLNRPAAPSQPDAKGRAQAAEAALAVIDAVKPVSAWTKRARADALRLISEADGQGDPRDLIQEADAAEAQAQAAWARADTAAGVPTPLPSSCPAFSPHFESVPVTQLDGPPPLSSAAMEEGGEPLDDEATEGAAAASSGGWSWLLALAAVVCVAAALGVACTRRRRKGSASRNYKAMDMEEGASLVG